MYLTGTLEGDTMYLTSALEGDLVNEGEAIFEVIMAENFKLTHDTKCGAGGIKRNTNPDTPQ